MEKGYRALGVAISKMEQGSAQEFVLYGHRYIVVAMPMTTEIGKDEML